ncbi:RidA family protein [Lonepinella sp. BR2271]|uniref:RidA family protein n=1 Tax=Lonepinella sp. BR2271 TaxID=3434550 RepID=UPI003F6DB8AC
MTIQRFHISKRLSEVTVYNGVAYLAGQIPANTPNQPIYEQTKDVLAEIDRLLAEVNSDKSRILRAEVVLVDMNDYAEMNRAWDEWVADNNAPPRATIQAKLANEAWKIEIVITAATN